MLIELHYKDSNAPFLINTDHIVRVDGSELLIDEIDSVTVYRPEKQTYHYGYVSVMESYEEIKKAIRYVEFQNWMANMPEKG